MIGVATVRTGKRVTMTLATQATPRAGFARVGRIDLCHAHAILLCLVGDPLSDETMLPEGEATTQGFALDLALLWLRHLQVFKDEHGMRRRKVNQLLCRLLRKGAGAMVLCATKPFQHPPHTSGVLVLCLTGRQLLLEAAARFAGLPILDFDGFPTDEEFSAIRVNGHKGVGFVEVNANRKYPLWFRDFKGDGKPSHQLAIAHDDRQAIEFTGLVKEGDEMFRDGVGKAFASGQCPDRELAIREKGGITSTLADEEEGRGFPEEEGVGSRLLVALRSMIRTCDQPDRRNGHLGIQNTLHVMIVPTLQSKGIQGLAIVVTWFRKFVFDLSKCFNRALQVRIRLDQDRDGSLNLH